MKLIAPLAAGIRGAENGSVNLVLRGTTTAANYYADFEGTQLLPGTGVSLDSDGRLIAYVSALVDVTVHSELGTDVCEFVAGDYDAAVEVISPSFTGIDYTSGAIGTQKPTNLETVLDRWLTSAGAADWKVLFNGVPTNLQSAFSTTFFNVKNYGAVGNGVADDGPAISTAQAAATLVGGGTVFFPPGTYRITAAISLAANVEWLGSGGTSSKLAIDSAVSAGAVTLPANPVGSISGIRNLWIGAINGAAPGTLINYTAVSSGEFHFTDCILGNDLVCNASLFAGAPATSALKTVFTRCYMKLTSSTSQLLINASSSRMIVHDCDLINANAVGVTMVDCADNGVFEGNRFDWSAALAGPGIKYINISPSVLGAVTIVGNTFIANTVMACTAIFNTMAAPFRDAMEYGNIFGNMLSSAPGCTPYAYTTDGYVVLAGFLAIGGHQTRYSRTEAYDNVAAAAQTVGPKANGTTTIRRTAGGNLTVNADKGSTGDRWTLHINNSTGGAITVIGGTNIIFDPAVAPLPITNGGFAEVTLAWLPSAGAVGFWYQVGKAVLS